MNTVVTDGFVSSQRYVTGKVKPNVNPEKNLHSIQFVPYREHRVIRPEM